MALILNGTDGLSDVDGTAATPAIRGTDTNTGMFFPAADTIAFSEGGVESARFDSSGNLGIGTTSPVFGSGSGVEVYRTGTATYRLSSSGAGVEFRNNSGTGELDVRGAFPMVFSTNAAERMRIDSSGTLLVNRTTVVNAARIVCAATQNTRQMSFVNNNNNNEVGFIFCNNDGTTTQYSTTSDYRLKENIAPMTGALDKVAQLKPVTYTWKSSGAAGQGFIAHELAEICPDAVSGEKDAVNEDGSIKAQGIDTSFLVATLTAAIQELKNELDSVKVELAALKAQP